MKVFASYTYYHRAYDFSGASVMIDLTTVARKLTSMAIE